MYKNIQNKKRILIITVIVFVLVFASVISYYTFGNIIKSAILEGSNLVKTAFESSSIGIRIFGLLNIPLSDNVATPSKGSPMLDVFGKPVIANANGGVYTYPTPELVCETSANENS